VLGEPQIQRLVHPALDVGERDFPVIEGRGEGQGR
jgi:hypothetical protein